jgi:prevent-host-death family protein
MQTYKSDEARDKLRDILDAVTAGREVVIERYNKPVGVVVPHAAWLAYKRQRKERIERAVQRMAGGDYLTLEQVEAKLNERGMA